MLIRNPLKDKVAIVGVGTTEFSRDDVPGRTPAAIRQGGTTGAALAIEACKNAILDAGLTAQDIDGICGSSAPIFGSQISSPTWVVESLGIPHVTWFTTLSGIFTYNVSEAANAVFSGACTTAVVYHSVYRMPDRSHSAARDPFRVRALPKGGGIGQPPHPGGGGYDGFAARYIHEYNAKKEYFGLVAINGRTNAGMNEHAVMRSPITMDDYLNARMIRWPHNLLDMDLPIDGADAVVVTTAERAKDLKKKPVYVHATSYGLTEHPNGTNLRAPQMVGQDVVMEAIWQKSDLKLKDFDLFMGYDGFSIITLSWIENVGWCGAGEAGPFMEQHWDHKEKRLKINGRVPMNTHGGSLSEGGTQGSGHLREAIMQLRGETGVRQVPNCKSALLAIGGMIDNASGMVLRAD